MGVRDMPCGNFFKRFKRTPKNPSVSKGSIKKQSAVQSYEAVEGIQLTKKRSPEEVDKVHSASPEPVALEAERLPCPTKSPTDNKDYTVIQLSNGVVATIISVNDEAVEDEKFNRKSSRMGTDVEQQLSEPSHVSRLSLVTSKHLLEGNKASKDDENDDPDWPERGFKHKSTFAACAVTVKAGSFNDPDNIPGLSHLLEHVLSMGSDKFSGEDEFEALLGQNGGSYFAETETEYMTFYFECLDKFLREALEVFSRFFISPLFKWDSVRRERLAVASEFAEQSSSDNARRMQIICLSATPNNPAKKFTWGTLETLKNNIGDEQLLSALVSFKKTHFTGDKIKIAIQAKFPVETLEGWVNKLFSEIPKASKQPAIIKPLENAFDKATFCRFYKVQSVGDVCEVNINWALTPMESKYKYKPIEYISYVIGAEGEGSLISYLRAQQMALYLTSEVEEGGLVSNSLYTIFTICVSLTDEGRENVKKVVKSVFGYLKMLKTKGPSKSIWLELQGIADTSFNYNRKNSPGENVREISQNMTIFPPNDYLTGWTKFYEYNNGEIIKYLSVMTPANANVLLHMKKHDEILDQEEKWFQTKYRVDDMPVSWLQEWNTAEPEKSFNLPRSNPYIADDFSIVEGGDVTDCPLKLIDTKSYEIWHKEDTTFNTPYASINILLGISKESQSVQNIVCQTLFAKMFVYQMIDELYFAQVAHIEHKMTTTEYGLEISIHGISQKLPKLLKEVAHGLVEFREKGESQEHMLKYLKIVLERNMINTLSNGATFIEDIRKSIISSLTYSCGEKYPHVRSLSKEIMNEYWQAALENLYVVALVQGNISANKAKGVIEEFVYILKSLAKTKENAQPSARIIPAGESLICLAAFHPQEMNCYTQFYYQFGQGSVVDSAALQLFVATMGEPLFDELRTKEQLGYSVSVAVLEILGILGILITVNSQTSRHSPEYVRTRIDTFVRDYLKYFRIMSRVEFDEIKEVLIAMKQVKPENLKDESSRNWREIKNRRNDFYRTTKEIEAIAKLDKKSTVKVIDKTMDTSKQGAARKLTLQIVGYKPESKVDENERTAIVEDNVIYRNVVTEAFTPSSKIVKDVVAWKNSLPNYLK